jgi:hypothetical protein
VADFEAKQKATAALSQQLAADRRKLKGLLSSQKTAEGGRQKKKGGRRNKNKNTFAAQPLEESI